MNELNRRDALLLAATVTLGATATETHAQEAKQSPFAKETKPADNASFKLAAENPEIYMFSETVTFKTSVTAPHTQYLKMWAAAASRSGYDVILIPAGTTRMFRADPSLDAFTKKGGLYWSCGKDSGTIQFKQAGALIMVIRDHEGNVTCHTLTLDVRC